MAIGNPITLTSNVASKTISVIATAGQTLFTVTGGYRINQLAVFRNGVRLLDSRDYEARNGATVTLLSAATVGDALEFQVFDDFRVADAIVSAESEQTISGNLTVSGILTATDLRGSDVTFRHVKATGISTVSDTTQSTTTTTGALIVSGGLGVAKNLFVGGSMNVAGTLTYEDVTNSETAGVTTTGGLVVTGLGATFGSGVGIADSIYHIGDDNTAIRFPAADTFTVTTAGDERLRVNSSGQLGIGANNNSDYDTNARNLLLASSGSTGITIRSGDSSDFALIHFADGTTDDSEKRAGRILYGHSDDFMSFHTANEERLRIIGVGGSIGINETTPDSKVDIVHSTAENSSTENLIHLRTDPSGGYVTRGLFVKIGRDGAYDNSAAHYDIVGSSGNSGFHAFEVQGDEKLRITKDGKVGIGTINPGRLLELAQSNSTAYSATDFDKDYQVLKLRNYTNDKSVGMQFLIGGNGEAAITAHEEDADGSTTLAFGVRNSGSRAERMRIDSGGRLLINTTTNRNKYFNGTYTGQLQVEGTNDATRLTQFVHNQNTASQPILILGKSRGTTVGSYTVVQDGDFLGTLSFQGADGDEMVDGARIDAVVNGTVANDSMPTDFVFKTNQANERVRFTNTGRVGIGTDDPQGLLVIQGDSNGSTTPSIRLQDGTDSRQCSITNSSGDLILLNSGPDNTPHCKVTFFDGNIFSLETTNTERLRIDSVGTFHFKNGALVENGIVDTTARTGTQAVNLDNGMVHYFQSSSTGTWKPNFRVNSTNTLNNAMGTGDVVSPTMIVNKSNTAHYADTIQVDGSDVTPEWLGGAPTDGGDNNTFDVYSYTIIKTGDAAFKCFASVSNYT